MRYQRWDCFRLCTPKEDTFSDYVPPEERLFWNCFLLAKGDYQLAQQLYMQQPYDEIHRMVAFSSALSLYHHHNETN